MNTRGETLRVGSRYVSSRPRLASLVFNSFFTRPMVVFRYDVFDSASHQDLVIPLRRPSDGWCGEAGLFGHFSLAAGTANAPKSMVITYACCRTRSPTKRVGHKVGTTRFVTSRQRRSGNLAYFEKGTGRLVRTVWIY